MSEPSICQGRNAIELGAGTGIVSLLCKKFGGAKRVLATDGDEGVIESLKDSMFLNGISEDGFKAAVLRWGWTLSRTAVIRGEAADESEDERGSDRGRAWDLIVGADVVRSFAPASVDATDNGAKAYDKAAIPALVATLRELFDTFPKIEALISAAIRNPDTFNVFLQACGKLSRVLCTR